MQYFNMCNVYTICYSSSHTGWEVLLDPRELLHLTFHTKVHLEEEEEVIVWGHEKKETVNVPYGCLCKEGEGEKEKGVIICSDTLCCRRYDHPAKLSTHHDHNSSRQSSQNEHSVKLSLHPTTSFSADPWGAAVHDKGSYPRGRRVPHDTDSG